MKAQLEGKIQQIDRILTNDALLEEYLEQINRIEVFDSKPIEDSILKRVQKKKKRNNYTIVKLVACTILALILCQTDFIKGNVYFPQEQLSQNNKSYSAISNTLTEMNNLLMKPIHLEKKGEKE